MLGLVSIVTAAQFPTVTIDDVTNCLILGTDLDGVVVCKSAGTTTTTAIVFLLLESGDNLLLESGDKLQLE